MPRGPGRPDASRSGPGRPRPGRGTARLTPGSASRHRSRAPSRCRPRSAWSSAARCSAPRRRTPRSLGDWRAGSSTLVLLACLGRCSGWGRGSAIGTDGALEDGGLDAIRMLGGEPERPASAHRQSHDDRSLDAGRVHHRDGVCDELGVGIRGDLGRPVGSAVAAAVERHDPPVPGEERDLHLPATRVEDRVRRHQEDRPRTGAVALPEHPDAVALDEPGLVRVAGARLLARRRGAATGAGAHGSCVAVTRPAHPVPRAGGSRRRSCAAPIAPASRLSVKPSRIVRLRAEERQAHRGRDLLWRERAEPAAFAPPRVARRRSAARTSRRSCSGRPMRPPGPTSRRRPSPGGSGRSPTRGRPRGSRRPAPTGARAAPGPAYIPDCRSSNRAFSASSTARMSCCFDAEVVVDLAERNVRDLGDPACRQPRVAVLQAARFAPPRGSSPACRRRRVGWSLARRRPSRSSRRSSVAA